MAKKNKISVNRELWGSVLAIVTVLLFFSICSYDPADISVNGQATGERSTSNWIGPLGAWFAFGIYWLIGFSTLFVPFFLGYLAFALFFDEDEKFELWKRFTWGAVALFALACLIQIHPLFFTSLGKKLNLPFYGGAVGYGLGEWLFKRLVGPIGASLVFFGWFCAGTILAFRINPFRTGRRIMASFWEWRRAKQEKARAEALMQGNLRELTRLQDVDDGFRQKELLKRAREIEKNLLKTQKAARRNAMASAHRDPDVWVDPVAAPVSESDPSTSSGPSASARGSVSAPPRRKLARREDPETANQEGSATATFENYELPTIELLDPVPDNSHPGSTDETAAQAAVLEQTLRDFGIEATMGNITRGATVTRFEVLPAPGIKVERISSLQGNIALALKAESIHVMAPVPGRGTVGIEIPNLRKAMVVFREIIESDAWKKTKHKIPLILGKDVYGDVMIADLAEMPHLLIAGTTGSGKSVCINSIIGSMLYRFGPDQLRLLMIDPKMVEMKHYNSLPHLVVPVVTDVKKVISALRWVIREMDQRYQIFAKTGVRNIHAFNGRVRAPLAKPEPTAEEQEAPFLIPREDDIIVPDKLPFIVIVIDELADLMITAPADVENAIQRITQMARAAGIHLIVATQTPRAEVVTGTIKTNIPSRIAFQVPSGIDSRVILDSNGAEKLLGKGDMLFIPPGKSTPIRAQGALMQDHEIQRLVEHASKFGRPQFQIDIHKKIQEASSQEENDWSDEDRELARRCLEIIRDAKRASTSFLQRRLSLGYTRAARIVDLLEEMAVLGPDNGSKPREILLPLEDPGTFEALCQQLEKL
jgi:DNA segregation ATPase FtsK/SpoIIIE, S-DNA-T family